MFDSPTGRRIGLQALDLLDRSLRLLNRYRFRLWLFWQRVDLSTVGARFAFAMPALIVVVGVLAGRQLLGEAIPATHDGLIHLLRMQQFDEALRSGILYPRWAPDVSFGYGGPIFTFYPPLAYYLSSLVHAAGFRFVDSYSFVYLLALVGSGMAMYFLARQYLSRAASTVAGVAYILAPYHLIDVYVRGSVGELFGFLWIPVVLLGIEKIFTGSLRYWLVLTAGLTGLLLSHFISAVLFAPVFVMWTASALWHRR